MAAVGNAPIKPKQKLEEASMKELEKSKDTSVVADSEPKSTFTDHATEQGHGSRGHWLTYVSIYKNGKVSRPNLRSKDHLI